MAELRGHENTCEQHLMLLPKPGCGPMTAALHSVIPARVAAVREESRVFAFSPGSPSPTLTIHQSNSAQPFRDSSRAGHARE